jgi:hypothetical protein
MKKTKRMSFEDVVRLVIEEKDREAYQKLRSRKKTQIREALTDLNIPPEKQTDALVTALQKVDYKSIEDVHRAWGDPLISVLN